jgi:hypothetical protein
MLVAVFTERGEDKFSLCEKTDPRDETREGGSRARSDGGNCMTEWLIFIERGMQMG